MIIRAAEWKDVHDILEWRNDPHTRNMSFNSHKITVEDHNRWFKESISSDNHHLYIGLNEKEKIGLCYFHLKDTEKISKVSININPVHRGKGIAEKFLRMSMDFFFLERTTPILAIVKKINAPSMKIFQRCGYKKVSSTKDKIFYIYSP